MRRNKKLLLGAISAMSLVALGTGAVSTFAWFNASNSGIAAATNAQNVQVSHTSTLSDKEVEVTWYNETPAEVTGGTKLTAVEPSIVDGTALKTYVLDANGDPQLANGSPKNYATATFEIDTSEVVAGEYDGSYLIKIVSTANTRLSLNNASWTEGVQEVEVGYLIIDHNQATPADKAILRQTNSRSGTVGTKAFYYSVKPEVYALTDDQEPEDGTYAYGTIALTLTKQ